MLTLSSAQKSRGKELLGEPKYYPTKLTHAQKKHGRKYVDVVHSLELESGFPNLLAVWPCIDHLASPSYIFHPTPHLSHGDIEP